MSQQGDAVVKQAMEVHCGSDETEQNCPRLWMRERNGPSKEAHMYIVLIGMNGYVLKK